MNMVSNQIVMLLVAVMVVLALSTSTTPAHSMKAPTTNYSINNPLSVRGLSWAPNILDNLHGGPDTLGPYNFDERRRGGVNNNNDDDVPYHYDEWQRMTVPEGMSRMPQHGEHSEDKRSLMQHGQPESYNAIGMQYETATRALNDRIDNPLGENYSDAFAGDDAFGGWHFHQQPIRGNDLGWERGNNGFQFYANHRDWYQLPRRDQILPSVLKRKRKRMQYGAE